MTISIEIPDSVARAMRLPPADQRHQLKVELALSLYEIGIRSPARQTEHTAPL